MASLFMDIFADPSTRKMDLTWKSLCKPQSEGHRENHTGG